jgi:hypothetical protein
MYICAALAAAVYKGEKNVTPAQISELSWMCKGCLDHIRFTVHLKSGYKGSYILPDNVLHQMEVSYERDQIVTMFMVCCSLLSTA